MTEARRRSTPSVGLGVENAFAGLAIFRASRFQEHVLEGYGRLAIHLPFKCLSDIVPARSRAHGAGGAAGQPERLDYVARLFFRLSKVVIELHPAFRVASRIFAACAARVDVGVNDVLFSKRRLIREGPLLAQARNAPFARSHR